jgi:hypothetical protein
MHFKSAQDFLDKYPNAKTFPTYFTNNQKIVFILDLNESFVGHVIDNHGIRWVIAEECGSSLVVSDNFINALIYARSQDPLADTFEAVYDKNTLTYIIRAVGRTCQIIPPDIDTNQALFKPNVCQCSIKDLFSTGHNPGCVDKKA